jgi:hypothetical protein
MSGAVPEGQMPDPTFEITGPMKTAMYGSMGIPIHLSISASMRRSCASGWVLMIMESVVTEWQPIETAFANLPFKIIDYGEPFKSFAPAMVYGPVWCGESVWSDYPNDTAKGEWRDPRVAIASTHEHARCWTIEQDAPSDYDVYIKPTHWMPLPEPPSAGA